MSILLLLLGSSIAFQMLHNGWDFVDSLYFGFFALTTGGLKSPGSADDDELLFVSALAHV